MAEAHQPLPHDFDARDADFRQEMSEWAWQARSDMHATVIATHEVIAISWALMAEVDRILART